MRFINIIEIFKLIMHHRKNNQQNKKLWTQNTEYISINQSITQSLNQSLNQSITQSISQSINQSIK